MKVGDKVRDKVLYEVQTYTAIAPSPLIPDPERQYFETADEALKVIATWWQTQPPLARAYLHRIVLRESGQIAEDLILEVSGADCFEAGTS